MSYKNKLKKLIWKKKKHKNFIKGRLGLFLNRTEYKNVPTMTDWNLYKFIKKKQKFKHCSYLPMVKYLIISITSAI